MNILMTGSNGYIGSHLKPYLEDKGYNVSPYENDIRNFNAWDMDKVDMVIHLAALTGVRSSFDKQEEYYDVNVNGSKQIFKVCEMVNKPIIYTSSSNAKEWWTNPYAVTKKIMEELAPKNSIGVRPHTVYPGRPDMLYNQLSRDTTLIKYINGEHYRDFTHIEDFCSAMLILIENYDIIDDKIVDIGTGNATRVFDVATSFGWEGSLRWSPTPKERIRTEADTTLLNKFGWKLKYENCNPQ